MVHQEEVADGGSADPMTDLFLCIATAFGSGAWHSIGVGSGLNSECHRSCVAVVLNSCIPRVRMRNARPRN